MSDQKKDWNEAEKEPQRGEYTPSVETEFMRQTIKQKPVNKKKLIRRTLITMMMAVVFGMVACLTFLILQPVINKWLNPEEKAQEITFPEEVSEVSIDELFIDDDQMKEETEEPVKDTGSLENEWKVQSMIENIALDSHDYEKMYNAMRDTAKEMERSVVTVTGVTSDTGLFDSSINDEKKASGAIVADNGKALIIVVKDMEFEKAEQVLVTFNDKTEVKAEYVGKDPYSGVTVIAAPFTQIPPATRNAVKIMSVGTSNGVSMRGTPVMALGSPNGTAGSISYGMITSDGNRLDLVDSDYKLLSTDIYGSSQASGVIVNLKGYLVGIVDNSYNGNDTKNMICAIGISELKPIIEKITNQESRAYIGIRGKDIPDEVRQKNSIPRGAYVSGVEMNSPAMSAGIQTGDIIVSVNGAEVVGYRELTLLLNEQKPENIWNLTVKRQAGDGYAEIETQLTLNTLN